MHFADDHLIVTAADQEYAVLLKGLILSIRDGEGHPGEGRRIRIVVLDLGLARQTVRELSSLCDFHSVSEAPFPIARGDHPRPLLLSRALRPFLPHLFPGYRVYTWLDADTWVQDVSGLAVLREAALTAGLAVVPSLERSYECLYDKHSRHFRWMQPIIAQAFGESVAGNLAFRPALNSGVFSATPSSPVWEHYADALRQVFAKSRFVRDQPAFNVAIYRNAVPFYPLPSQYNWLCLRRLPRLDVERRTLTAPGLPREDLAIVHLTKQLCYRELSLGCSDGRERHLRLDYLGLRAGFRSDPVVRSAGDQARIPVPPMMAVPVPAGPRSGAADNEGQQGHAATLAPASSITCPQ
jgi:hypothetical protein